MTTWLLICYRTIDVILGNTLWDKAPSFGGHPILGWLYGESLTRFIFYKLPPPSGEFLYCRCNNITTCFGPDWDELTASFLLFGYIDLHDVYILSAKFSDTHHSQRGAASLQTTDWLCAEGDWKAQISGAYLCVTILGKWCQFAPLFGILVINWCPLQWQNLQLESQVEEAECHSSSHTETYQDQVLTLKSQLDDLRKVNTVETKWSSIIIFN